MAFPQTLQKRILRDRETKKPFPCVMCGTTFPLPEAAHIVDGKEWIQTVGAEQVVNGFPLCPSCHKVYDDVLRPYLFRSLEAFGTKNLPKCWKRSNKVSNVTDSNLPLDETA